MNFELADYLVDAFKLNIVDSWIELLQWIEYGVYKSNLDNYLRIIEWYLKHGVDLDIVVDDCGDNIWNKINKIPNDELKLTLKFRINNSIKQNKKLSAIKVFGDEVSV